MSDEEKSWQVTRFCCTSGMCLICRAVANGKARKRIVHADRLTEAKAKAMAANWSLWDAQAVPMPRCGRCGSVKRATESCDCIDPPEVS